MRLREHLVDPWGGLVAVLAGGLTWAVIPDAGLGLSAGIGVAAAVLGAKVAAGALADRGHGAAKPLPEPAVSPGELPDPPYGSPARRWLDRAERAVRTLDELAGAAGIGATAQRLGTVRDGAQATLGAMRRLGGQVTAFDQALARIDVDRLIAERQHLTAQLRSKRTDELRAERQQAADSLGQQLAVHQRLTSTRDKLLIRMQATAVGLEGLSARAAELVALSASAGSTGGDEDRLVEELTADLDAMRAGLAEVESLSRRHPDNP